VHIDPARLRGRYCWFVHLVLGFPSAGAAKVGDFFGGASLPMGMVFFGLMVFGVIRRQAGNIVARAQYPESAKRLGLAYEPSPYKKGVGRMEGMYQGFRVTVDPDDQRRIFLRFASAPAVELHSYVHNKRSSSGQRPFRPTSRVLSQQFKTAHGSQSVIDAVNAHPDLPGELRPFKFLKQLKTLSVTSAGVTAVFDFGNPPYIPVSIVEDVLPRLALLARVLEAPLASGAGALVSAAEAADEAQNSGK
jgi:hypothetical protein